MVAGRPVEARQHTRAVEVDWHGELVEEHGRHGGGARPARRARGGSRADAARRTGTGREQIGRSTAGRGGSRDARRRTAVAADGEDAETTSTYGEEGHGEHGKHLASVRRRQGARRRFVVLQEDGNETPKSRAKTGLCYRLEPPTGTKGLLVPVGGSNR